MKATIPDPSSATRKPASLAPRASTIESSANDEYRRPDYSTLTELVYEYQLLERLCDESISQQEMLTRALWSKTDQSAPNEGVDENYDKVAAIVLRGARGFDQNEIRSPSSDSELFKETSINKNCQSQQTAVRACEDVETLEFQIGLFQAQMRLISEKILNYRPLTASDVAEQLIHLAGIVLDGEQFDEMRISDAICEYTLTAQNALVSTPSQDHGNSELTISNVASPDN